MNEFDSFPSDSTWEIDVSGWELGNLQGPSLQKCGNVFDGNSMTHPTQRQTWWKKRIKVREFHQRPGGLRRRGLQSHVQEQQTWERVKVATSYHTKMPKKRFSYTNQGTLVLKQKIEDETTNLDTSISVSLKFWQYIADLRVPKNCTRPNGSDWALKPLSRHAVSSRCSQLRSAVKIRRQGEARTINRI